MKNEFSFKMSRFTGGPVETHAYLVELPEGNLLVDAPEGTADYFRDLPIHYLLLTHSHFDHVMDAAKIAREKKCHVAMHRTTEKDLADKNLYKKFGLPIEIEPLQATIYLHESTQQKYPFSRPDSGKIRPSSECLLNSEEGQYIKEKHVSDFKEKHVSDVNGYQQNILGTLFDIFELPGHCPGSICLYNDSAKILFGGDVLFAGGVGRWDLPGGDRKLLLEGIQKKLMTLPPETRVLPGHGPETTVGIEAATNRYLI